MRKYLKELDGYVINNPFYNSEPLKYTFMRNAYLVCQRIRTYLTYSPSLSETHKVFWENNHIPSNSKSNAATTVTVNTSDENNSPHFIVETIEVMELLPKEHIGRLQNEIKKFYKRDCKTPPLYSFGDSTSFFNEFNEGNGFQLLGSFLINDRSSLFKYISEIYFSIVNLSDSFCCLIMHLNLNEELKKKIDLFSVSSMNEQFKLTGYENYKWFQFKNLTYSAYSGSEYKCQLLNDVFADIIWNVCKVVYYSIPNMLFYSQKMLPPYVCSVYTNVDGNSNSEFWRSVGVNSHFCDYTQEYSSCIAWRSNGAPFFIRGNTQLTKSPIKFNLSRGYYISHMLCFYLVPNTVINLLRKNLTKFSEKISTLKQKGITKWLKVRVDMDSTMFFLMRFIEEYNIEDNSFDFKEYSNIKRTPSLVFKFFSDLNRRISRSKALYKSISNIFNSNIDYRNEKSNYRLQKIALIVSILSMLVATAALIVTLCTDEGASRFINSLIDSWIKPSSFCTKLIDITGFFQVQ